MPNETMDDGMDSMYPSEEGASPPEKATPETIDEEEAEDSSKTILAPKAALGSMTKVGEQCMMRVVADHGDEVELEYVTPKNSKTMSSDEELDSMSKEY